MTAHHPPFLAALSRVAIKLARGENSEIWKKKIEMEKPARQLIWSGSRETGGKEA